MFLRCFFIYFFEDQLNIYIKQFCKQNVVLPWTVQVKLVFSFEI